MIQIQPIIPTLFGEMIRKTTAVTILIENGVVNSEAKAKEMLKGHDDRIKGHGNTRFVPLAFVESIVNPSEDVEDVEDVEIVEDVEENSLMTPEAFLLKYKALISDANIGDKTASRKLKKLLHPDSTPYKHLENHIVFKTLFKTLLEAEKYDRYFERNKEEITERIKRHSDTFEEGIWSGQSADQEELPF